MRFAKSIMGLFILIFCLGDSFAQDKPSAKPPAKAHSNEHAKPKASSPLDAVIDALFAAHTFAQAAISPDGKKVAWVETLLGKDGAPDGNTAIYLTGLQSNEGPARVSAATKRVSLSSERVIADGIQFVPRAEASVAWSPDSTKLAFLSDSVKPGQLQLYVKDLADHGSIRRLTNAKGLLATPRWSPDGKSIAVLFTQNATRAAGPLVSEPPETGEIKDAFFEQRLALVDVATGELRQISPADMHVYEYDWSPDSQHFALTAAHGNGDNNWWIAQLYTLDAGLLGVMKPIYKPSLQIARPAFSPDGQQIAFVEGLMSDEDSVGGDVFTISAKGGAAKNVTPEMKASASWLSWTPEGKILFSGSVEGDAQAASIEAANGRIETMWRGQEQVGAGLWGTNLSIAADGKTSAVIRSSLSDPPEIWAGPIGYWKQITNRNTAVKPAWGETKSIRWKSDGFDVQGWLTYPKDFDPSKKYPMVVRVHGGPGLVVQSSWPDYPGILRRH